MQTLYYELNLEMFQNPRAWSDHMIIGSYIGIICLNDIAGLPSELYLVVFKAQNQVFQLRLSSSCTLVSCLGTVLSFWVQ